MKVLVKDSTKIPERVRIKGASPRIFHNHKILVTGHPNQCARCHVIGHNSRNCPQLAEDRKKQHSPRANLGKEKEATYGRPSSRPCTPRNLSAQRRDTPRRYKGNNSRNKSRPRERELSAECHQEAHRQDLEVGTSRAQKGKSTERVRQTEQRQGGAQPSRDVGNKTNPGSHDFRKEPQERGLCPGKGIFQDLPGYSKGRDPRLNLELGQGNSSAQRPAERHV
jgi:hypothetical protein